MQSTTTLRKWDEREAIFKSPRWIGLLFALIGIGVIVGCAIGKTYRQHNGWVPFAVGGLFAVIGILAFCFMDECRLDLINRRYYRKKGFFLSPKTTESTFDDFRGLLFKTERRSNSNSSSSSYTVWCVYLQWNDGDKIPIGEWRDPLEAHNKLEEFAKKLNLPMIDTTGGEEVVCSIEEADVTFREKAAERKAAGEAPFEFPAPPADLRMEFSVEGKEIHFTLPRVGLGRASIFFGVFALFWNGIVFFFIVALLMGNVENAPNLVLMFLFLVPFVAAGIAMAFGVLYVALAKTHVLANPDHIRSYATFFGRDWGVKTIPCAEIEEIGLHKADESGKESIYIRSDQVGIDIGSDLRDSEKQWLCSAIQAIVAA
ncbi:MAG: hypothetical protein GXP25_14530 [Planctomycetes bacterium]|nr:hypothetical protein [Planctomycetota bacterium]